MIELLSAGTLATVQDWPGRLGYWEVGVPPSGPMDARSFRLGNELVGNPQGAAGIEFALTGPRVRFARDTVVAVTGAPLAVQIDGEPAEQWRSLEIRAGSVLKLGPIRRAGLRAYLLVRGGIDRPEVMGSRATFAAAGLGGTPLRKGDELAIGDAATAPPCTEALSPPEMTNAWTLRVVPGPHGAPDFLTADGIDELWRATWTVHLHSDRTGVRLTGPSPDWARRDGGEAGLHPSNILDSAYGVGTVMLAGDMAVVVGPDGPSLGGFAAIAQVIRADLWRLGQVRAGDAITLDPVDPAYATALHAIAEAEHAPSGASPEFTASPAPLPPRQPPPAPIFDTTRDGGGGPLTFRRAGERCLLVEFGEPLLDLRSRVRVHLLRAALETEGPAGLLDLTPGVRSLHIQHDPDLLPASELLRLLIRLETQLPAPEATTVPGRIVHLPLAWRDPLAMSAVARYEATVRADAPWCPDNIEFIRRMNGLPDEDAVREVVFGASYLVLGLGDVYMGAPVAVPLDPRHRLVTTKYNPARTWTPPNAVGIGGAFLCVYGMEGPGGYQLVGRTVPIWQDGDDPPWRLRHFDELRFEPVEAERLDELRADSAAGRWAPQVEPGGFSLAEHERFLVANAESIAAFRASREIAFAAEREAWARDSAIA
ncbi:MAG TPA: 5-oxoprolinase/urea amidolyase family protein [Solirubrobacteraceae bacterium]|nr:5-oxoprolinase/urea amidolyase family protein [Solirubrobacteraceae bacterium]